MANDPFVTLSPYAVAVPVTCDIARPTLRRKAFRALTRMGAVATVRTGPERPLGPGSGKAPQFVRSGTHDASRTGRIDDPSAEPPTGTGLLGANF
jgi:hypothetical protein